MSKTSVIDEIVDYFNHHDEVDRIKKLMYYAHSRKWLSDDKKILILSTKNLVESLRAANNTIDELSYLMNRMVETLNRQDIYSNVANIIIQNFSKLYNDSEDTTQIVFVESKKQNDLVIHDYLIDRVVVSLEENIDSARIKKLIFCTCKKRWENNSHILDQYSWHDLIYELRQQNKTSHQLKQGLAKVVKTLNRQAVYSNISNIIIQALDILYKNPEPQDKKVGQSNQENKVAIDNFDTALIHGDLDYFYEEQGLNPQINKESVASSESVESTGVKRDETEKVYNLFDIKMSLMQYANPLRAKILLFSVLDHNFDDSWQDWSVLRACELEDLIHQIYNQTQNISELESSLNNTAKMLPDKSEYQQAAQGVIKALKPYYY
jgi:hypothetical protein